MDRGPVVQRSQRVCRTRSASAAASAEDVGHQHRLVDLHPLHAPCRRAGPSRSEYSGNQLVEPASTGRGPRPSTALLSSRKVIGPMITGRARNALVLSLFEFRTALFAGCSENVVLRRDLGHDVVVVVGVEPLGHFQRRDVPRCPGRREIAVQLVGHGPAPGLAARRAAPRCRASSRSRRRCSTGTESRPAATSCDQVVAAQRWRRRTRALTGWSGPPSNPRSLAFEFPARSDARGSR